MPTFQASAETTGICFAFLSPLKNTFHNYYFTLFPKILLETQAGFIIPTDGSRQYG